MSTEDVLRASTCLWIDIFAVVLQLSFYWLDHFAQRSSAYGLRL